MSSSIRAESKSTPFEKTNWMLSKPRKVAPFSVAILIASSGVKP
jgi:hypothetical protein